jgi:hypothetical protein
MAGIWLYNYTGDAPVEFLNGNDSRAIYRGKEENMKPFTAIAAVIFALIALVHILRLVLGWEVTVSGMAVPMWASVAGLVIAAGLAVMLLREARK